MKKVFVLGNYEISIPRLLLVVLIFLVVHLWSYGYYNVWMGYRMSITDKADRIHSHSKDGPKWKLYHKSEKEIEDAIRFFLLED